jgi:hypothetical protein
LPKNSDSGQEWWHTPIIPVLRKLSWEDHKFKAFLGYIARPCHKKKKESQILVLNM